MKPPHHPCWKLYHLLLILTLSLSSFPSSSAQSQNQNMSSQEENSSIALEDRRQIQSSGNNTFLLDTWEEITLDLLSSEKKSFVFYSNRENYSVHISLKLTLDYRVWKYGEGAFELALAIGQMTKGRYLPEKDLEGEGQEQEISLERGPWIDFNVSDVYLSCLYQIERGQKGKYMIEIANLWTLKIGLGVGMSMHYSDPFLRRIGESFEERLVVFGPNVTQLTYDIFMVTQGKWYLSIYSCGLPVNITVEHVDKSPYTITLQNGEHLYQETIEKRAIEAPPKDRFKKITMTIPEGVNSEGRIEMFSRVINEERFINYELKEDPKRIILKKRDDIYRRYKLNDFSYPITSIVQFEPLKFKEFKPTDEIGYQVEVFYENPEINCEKGLMTSEVPGPSIPEIRVPIDHKEPVTASFAVSYDFSGYIRVKAFVIREEHKIQYFTYPIRSVNERDPIWREDMGSVGRRIVGIVSLIFIVIFVVIAVILCYKGWSRRRREHKAFEDEREGVDLNADENSSKEEAIIT